MRRSLPVLLYHHVSPDRPVTPEAFEAQLRVLLEQGAISLSIDELQDVIEGRRAIDQPSFVVSFDDGYIDNWWYAFPVLKKLRVKATMYLVTDYVENSPVPRAIPTNVDTRSRERDPGGFVSWAEVKAMQASGLITFGSHTESHRRFIRREPYGDLEGELRRSKAIIEKALEGQCNHLAWPWGDFELQWLPLVKKIGYRTAATTLMGANALQTNPFLLKRFNITRSHPDWFSGRVRWLWNPWLASGYGAFYGWDRRLKQWWNKESPYSHG